MSRGRCQSKRIEAVGVSASRRRVPRIERVAQAPGDPRRVLAGTDCGFDTSAGMGRVAEDVVWAKLRSLRDGARLASSRLFLGHAS